jgi:outer membrane protein, heavy metal efflux system
VNRSLLIISLLLSAGCAHFQDRPLSAEKSLADFDARTLRDVGLKAFLETNHITGEWPRTEWNLETLTLAALYFHPDLDVARAQLAGAKARKVTAGERPNPTVSVSPAYDITTTTPSPWIVTPSLDIPIETAGKRGYRIAQAAHLSDAARLNLAATAWQVRSRVRKSLLSLEAASETESLLKTQQVLQAENVRLLQGQLEAGAISVFEVTQARLATDNARLALRDVEQQAAEARGQLAEGIGIPIHALEGLELSFAGLDKLPAEVPTGEARRQALLNRADILGALSEYAASQSALQLEIAKQYPDVHLSPGYEFDQGDNKWSLGLSVTLPVVNRNQGTIAEAEARRTESAATFNALQARVLAEIDRALAGYGAALAKQVDAALLLSDQEKQERVLRARLAAGDVLRGELLGAQIELVTARLTQLDAQIKARQALGALEDAVQSPLSHPASVDQLNTARRSASEKSTHP